MPTKWLSTEEAAAELGVTRQYIGHLARTGGLPAYRGARRRLLFDPKDIRKYLDTHPTDRNPQPLKGA